MRSVPFLKPHYGRSKHAWHWWLLRVGLDVMQDLVGASHWSQRGDEAMLAQMGGWQQLGWGTLWLAAPLRGALLLGDSSSLPTLLHRVSLPAHCAC